MNVRDIEDRLQKIQEEKEDLEEELKYLLKSKAIPWPREFSLYIHSSDVSEDSAYIEFINESGWDPCGEEALILEKVGYEHLMTYSVDGSGSAKLISVDGIPLKY
jgi:hypothetical protein